MSDVAEPKSGTPAVQLPEGLSALGEDRVNGAAIVGKLPYQEVVPKEGEVLKVWRCKEKCFHNGRMFKRGDLHKDVQAPNDHFEGYVEDATSKRREADKLMAQAEVLINQADKIDKEADTGVDPGLAASEDERIAREQLEATRSKGKK